MKKYFFLSTVLILLPAIANSQDLLNKLKKKAAEKAAEVIGVKPTAPSGGTTGNQPADTGKPSNKTGGGLVSTPPDVRANLGDASTSYQSKKYAEARYSIQQAMLGVEMEIGNKILKSLPEAISGLKREESQDRVTSNGYGWAGLTIERDYRGDGEKQLELTIANNAVWLGSVNMYLTGGGYAQSTGGQQNMKQTKVKGYRAVIEYDDDSGYKLSVPIGQSSLLVLEAVNFSTEQEVMTAANAIDLDGIKKMLGEQ